MSRWEGRTEEGKLQVQQVLPLREDWGVDRFSDTPEPVSGFSSL